MTKQTVLCAAVLVFLMQSLQANPVPRQATITGGPSDSGRCTVEVNIDGAAEVEVSGDHGVLTTLSGQTATWRRFQCSEPLPGNPIDFRLIATYGRGAIRLRQDPRNAGGRAVIHLSDSKGGRAGYTFDLWWRRAGNGGWAPGPRPQPPGHWPRPGGGGGWVPPGPPQPPPGQWPGSGSFPLARAIQICQDSVTGRLVRDGYPYVTFEHTIPNGYPDRRDSISGTVSGRRRFETARFAFSCSIDITSERVRWFDVRPY